MPKTRRYKKRGGCPPYDNEQFDLLGNLCRPLPLNMQPGMGYQQPGVGQYQQPMMQRGVGQYQKQPGFFDSIFGSGQRPNQNMAYNNGPSGGKLRRRRRRTRKNRRSRK